MRSRTKTLLALAVACLSTAVVASGAMAHGGHKGDKDKTSLEVEVTGVVTANDGVTVVVSAGALAAPACTVRIGKDVSAFPPGTRVKAKCVQRNGVLKLKKLRPTLNPNDKLKIEANGVVKAFTAAGVGIPTGIITVDTGLTPLAAPITCVVTERTRVRGNPVIDGMAKVECKSKDGVLTAKKIKAKVVKIKAEGPLGIAPAAPAVPASVTVNGVTCSVPSGMVLPPAGSIVEIKCTGAAPNSVLTKIEFEDDGDDH